MFIFNVGNIKIFQACLCINFQSFLNIWYMNFIRLFFSYQKLYRIQIILQFKHKKLDCRVVIASTINYYCPSDQPHFRRRMVRWCLQSEIRIKQWFVNANLCECKLIQQLLIFWIPNATILSINQFIKMKISLIAEDDFVRKTFIISKILLNNENALFFRSFL